MLELFAFIITLALGWALGTVLARRSGATLADDGEQRAARVRHEAQRSVELQLRQARAQADEEVLELQRLAEAEGVAAVEQCERLEVRNAKLAARQEALRQELGARKATVEEQVAELARRRDETRKRRDEAKRLAARERPILEERAETTGTALSEALVDRLVEDARSQGADQLRNLESSGIDFVREAKRAMGIAMQRYTGYCPRERGAASMALEPGACAKLQEGFAALISELSAFASVVITFPDEGDTLRFESSDGIARELCRRVIAKVLKRGKPTDNAELFAATERELKQEIADLGKKAFRQLKLDPAQAEVSELVGQLNWRTSYTQNQYRHAIEAGALAGLIAAELGIDGTIARRGALLHDLGKALSHSVEGSHALNGAAIAERCGEDVRVVNAIAAHHAEAPMESAYAWLAAATDAMSGGRPGARREATESYGDRIGDLERIANGFRGVASVHAMQAGREVRVFVDDSRVDDSKLDGLSEGIAAKISDELTFPGQIRVTVIREFRAVAVAN